MKKILLLLTTIMLSVSSAFAQWAKPVLPNDELVSGQKYVIANVAAVEANAEGAFLSGTTVWYSWSTSTGLVPVANALTFILTDTGDNGWTVQRATDNKYTFISGNTPQGLENTGEMHVDRNTQDMDLAYFGFAKNGNYYRIFAAKSNTAKGVEVYETQYNEETGLEEKVGDPKLFWGWMANNTDESSLFYPYQNAVYGTVSPEDGFGCDWALINAESEAFPVYKARVALYALEAEALEYSVDMSAATAVYNNAEATVEQIEAATEELKEAIKAAKVIAVLDGATEEDPRDATSLLVNSDFSAGNIDGWACTFIKGTTAENVGYQDASYTNGDVTISKFIEAWTPDNNTKFSTVPGVAAIGNAELCQTIKGLPAGKYVLAADVIAVQQGTTASNPVTGVQLYAVGGDVDMFLNVATGNKAPEHFELEFLSSGGDITMGLRTRNATANWIAADNFTLTYYGETEVDPHKLALDKAIEAYEEQYSDDYYAYKEVKDAFQAALENAKAATENYQEYQAALDSIAGELAKSVAAYNKFNKNIVDANTRVEELDGTDWADLAGELADYVAELNEAYEEGTYTEAQIDSVATSVENLINNYVSENLKAGDDVTLLLKNPGFTSDFSGWTSTGAGVVWQANHGNGENIAPAAKTIERPDDNDGLAERWHDTFSISQVIKNMPAGLYTLTCQGFNRHDDGVNDKFAELYAILPNGSVQTAHFADIYDYATEETLFDNTAGNDADPTNHWRSDEEKTLDNGDVVYIPNSMTGAAWHFMNKSNGEDYDYISKFDIALTEPGDLTVGARCDDKHQWVIFDNFRIVYKGTGAGVWEQPIRDLQANAQAINGVTYPVADSLSAAVQAGDAAIASGEEETCLSAMELLRNTIKMAEDNISLQKAIDALYDPLNAIQDKIQAMDDQTLDDKFYKLYDVIDAKNYMDKDNAGLQSFIDETNTFITNVDSIYTAWQMEMKYQVVAEAVANATDEDPANLNELDMDGDIISVIVNPDLSTGNTDGWTLDMTTYKNKGYQANKVYEGRPTMVNDEDYTPTCNQFIEVWIPAADGPILGDIYQNVMLPKGTYSLSADIIAVNQADAETPAEGCYLYAGNSHVAVSSGNESPEHFEIIFKVEEDRSIIRLGINCSAETTANWLAADNFVLTAFGPNSEKTGNGEENAINSIAAGAQKNIYTITGVRVNNAQKPGLYIVNGKKVLVK